MVEQQHYKFLNRGTSLIVNYLNGSQLSASTLQNIHLWKIYIESERFMSRIENVWKVVSEQKESKIEACTSTGCWLGLWNVDVQILVKPRAMASREKASRSRKSA